MIIRSICAAAVAILSIAACAPSSPTPSPPAPVTGEPSAPPAPAEPVTPPAEVFTPVDVAARVASYKTIKLAPDLSTLTANERRMIPILIDAARAMDEVYWIQTYGDKNALLQSISDPAARTFALINYGPWDRLDGNRPFLPGVGPRPAGANFYPIDMTKEQFEAEVAKGGVRADSLKSLYTMIRRDMYGALRAIPYSRFFAAQHERAANRLEAAATLADDAGLRNYLTLRARALRTDDYQPSDMAWMDMKTNTIEFVVGPIETYDDELFGYKAANEAFVLIKDKDWSARLARYASQLPDLQRGLPVDDRYKLETPGSESELNAYDVVYVSGQANVGAKTIAINLPNDEQVQLQKGARRLQLKNAMRAKFDHILLPIAQELIVPDQLRHVTFDAFFENVMFHEVAHGLGIKNTINDRGTVRAALKERAGSLEEGKADILGLYMVRQLRANNELTGGTMEDNLVSFIASIFRSVRFGAGSAHGRANVAALNFLERRGAFTREANGRYRVDFARMQQATDELARTILVLQGNGDYEGVGRFTEEYGQLSATLLADLERLDARGIPVDIVYDQ
ncbi:MAG: dipeptidyl-peptidase 3 family protein [Gemmatimonadaceae bacterium]